MVISPAALGTKNDSACEDQQQFTRPTTVNSEMERNLKEAARA
jgi:hypothetical protein